MFRVWLILFVALGGLMACQSAPSGADVSPTATLAPTEEHDDEHADEHDDEHADEGEVEALTLPELAPVALDGRRLRVVATSSLMGDVVGRIGGEAIELTTLMAPGQDPHSYVAKPSDLLALSQADVIFVNGWDLEEGLAGDIATVAADNGIPVVPISANIVPLAWGGEDGDEHEGEGEEEHGHGAADPHVWFAVHHVAQWAENTAVILATLDPATADSYQANAEAMRVQLEALEEELSTLLEAVPATRRKIVTNHDAFGYFAHEYGFEVVGTVIPSVSTLAEPSAQDLAGLIEMMRAENICVIFTETTVSDKLATTVAAELPDCEAVQVVQLFTGALGGPGSGAENYFDFMRTNVARIVAALP